MTNLEPVAPAAVLAAVRAPFLGMAATPADVPVIQPLALLLDLAGEAVRARLFTVQADGVEEACLRPDFTIPVARAHIASGAASGRYLYEGKAFRVAPPGSDRPEEFLQIGLEVFEASPAPALDAMIATLAWQAASAGGRDDLSVQFGDIGLFAAFVEALDLSPAVSGRLLRAFLRPRALSALIDAAGQPAAPSGERLPALLAGLPEDEATAVLKEMWALAGIQPVGGRSAAEIVHRLAMRAEEGAALKLSIAEAGLLRRFLAISGPPARAVDAVDALAKEAGAAIGPILQDWQDRLQALARAGLPQDRMTLATGFGREFGYYDGFLFEVRSAALGEEAPVAAGGRYDTLLRRLMWSEAAKASTVSGAPYADIERRVEASRAVGCMVRPWRAYAKGSA